MAKQELSALAQADERLSVVFGILYPKMAEVKATTGRTANWSELDGLVPDGLVSLTNSEGLPKVDSQGRPMSAARLLFSSVASKYRPKNPKYGNRVVFGKIRALQARANAASGIKRGRTSGAPLSDDAITSIDENIDIDTV